MSETEILFGVVREGSDGEWLDYGSLRPDINQSRAAATDFDSKAQRLWREANRPVKIRRYKLVPASEPD